MCAGLLTDPLNNTIVLKTMCDELLEHCTSVDAAVFLDCCRTPFPGVEDDGARSVTPVARSVRGSGWKRAALSDLSCVDVAHSPNFPLFLGFAWRRLATYLYFVGASCS